MHKAKQCTLTALAPRKECVLGTVVGASSPQLEGLLAFFARF